MPHRNKDESYGVFSIFWKQVQVEKDLKITTLRSGHCGEFKN